ncbi:MAG: S8 family serine peptidase [Acidobacteriota bacterium]|nr:S8 family serine peptidase [Acidobacteriota bacterium]
MQSLKVLFILLAGLTLSGTAFAAPDDTLPPHRDGVILLKFNLGIPQAQQQLIFNLLGSSVIKQIGDGVIVLNVGSGRVAGALQSLAARSEILYIEPDYQIIAHEDVKGSVHSIQENSSNAASVNTAPATQRAMMIQPMGLSQQNPGALPNDTNIGVQWAVQNTGQNADGVTGTSGADERALAAWAISTGTNSVVVAVLDTGIQYSHPDLITNIWDNPGGVGTCAAGTHGYNVLTSLCDPMDDETFYGGHGSHVAGIIGAAGNNALGVAGVNWTTSLMAVKWVDSTDSGYTSDLITAMDWIIKAKKAGVNVRVANDSQTWAGTAFSQALSDEIDLLTTNDILFVTAAGNTAQNNDTTPRYPCSYARPGMICAAASDQNDNLWTNSNYGPTSVQLAAPGVNIFSTLDLSNFGYISGGSMAAAQVSGAAALILSKGYLSVSNLRSTILTNVDTLSSLTSFVGTGGRLNVCKAVPGCSTVSTAMPVNSAAPVVTGVAQAGSVVGASAGLWSGAPATFTYQWYRCNSTGTNCAIIPGATAQMYAVLANADTGSTIAVTVTASNASGSASAQSAASVVVAGAVSAFSLNSTISDGQNIGGTLLWEATPAQQVNFVSFYIDGVLSQTIPSSPYEYNQSTTGTFDSTTLSNGSHVLGIRALGSDNRTYAFYGATVTVGNPPRNTAVPVISGNPAQGQTLTTSNGSWTNNPTGFTYQWSRCNTAGYSCNGISGATSSSYLIGTADVGFTLRVSVTATNSVGSTTAQSAATAVISGQFSITTTSLPNGTQNTAYSATLAATGGTTPYTWVVTVGTLPAGLSLAAGTGVISGTPTASGTSNFTVQVTDANSKKATQALSLVISAASGGGVTLLQSAQNGTAGTAGSSTTIALSTTGAGHFLAVQINNGDDTVASVSDTQKNTFAKAVSLKVGNQDIEIWYAMNIVGGTDTITVKGNSNTAYIWAAASEYSGVTTTNALDAKTSASGSGQSASSGNTLTTTQANEVVIGIADWYSCNPNTIPTPGTGYTSRQTASCLANSDETVAQDRVLSSAGTYSVTATGANSSDSTWIVLGASFKATGASAGPTITTTSLPNGTQNTAYSLTLAATGGTTPYTWAVITGTLPTGLSLNTSTGVISGTPTASGTSNFTVQVTDSNAKKATQALSLLINAAGPTITTTSLPNGIQNTAYSATLAATGGTTPYTWAVTAGTLPTGLSLTAGTGVISGTPTASGTSNFTVQVTDSNATKATQALSIVISAASGGGATLLQSTQNGTAGTSGAITTVTLSATGAGHFLAVQINNGDATVASVSDTQKNTFTKAVSLKVGNQDIEIWYAMNITGGADTVTVTGNSNTSYIWAAASEYSGVATTNALDAKTSASGSGQSASSGNTLTTTQANEVVIGIADWYSCNPNTIPTPGTGYTSRQTASCLANSDETVAQDRVLSSAGTYSVTATGANSSDSTWIVLGASFK